jgi:cephalosporin-C deacetylase-like acetyl esterase
MRMLATAVLLAFPALLSAQENLNVIKADPDGVTPRKMLHTYLQAEAQKLFDARRQTIAALKTPEDVAKRQAGLKGKFIEALGGFPERTPLNAKVVGTEQRDGYRVERVIYESRPNHHVTANLYLPDGKGPFPGVLVPCGHSLNGKAANQQPCVLLARHGIAAMSYDPIGQGERIQLLDNGKALVGGNTNEHTMVGIGALLVGRSTATYRIWDGIRSLDYLAGRAEIDPKRLGCTGCSGGGTLTSYLMALDERIIAAAPSCYITSMERLFATIGPQDAEQNITGQVAFGMEHADYLLLRAPKPTLILCATRDFFDIQGTWTTFREAKQVYGIDGFGERVDLFEYNTGHGYPKPQREAMLRFMRRWLLQKDDAPTEEPFTSVKDAQLQCTRTGQVLEDFKGKSVFDLNVERELELAKQRGKWQEGHSKEELLKEVRRLIGLAPTIAPAKLESVGEIGRDGYVIRKLLFTTEPGVSVPALFFVPKDAGERTPIVLYAHGDGKAVDAAAGGPIEKLTKAGNRVLALDLRGFGETARGTPTPNRPNYFGVDFTETFMAIHLNRPLLGQRTHDVLAVVECLARDAATKQDGYAVVGIGTAGPVALHAAALEPRINALTLDKALVSWSSVVKTPVTYNQLTNVVAGALATYDLPDLAKAMAPRKLTITNPVDPVGKPAAQAAPAPVADPNLPRVVLIGDSIRMGYAPLVAKRLEGKAVVISDKENGGDSSNVLKHLDTWAIKEKPAVIHLNCGLHDLKLGRKTKLHQVEPEQYEANLRQIVDRLRKETSATIVFADTTPIHDERHAARKGDFDRTETDVKRYNDRAGAVMRSAGIPVHDLHWVVEQGGVDKMLGPDGTH